MSKHVGCGVTSSFLDSGRTIAHAANAAAVVAGLGCLWEGPVASRSTLAASIVFWLVECWFAVRVSIDASLFRVMAEDADEGARRLDAMLDRAGRPIEDRTRGALAPWRKQIAALVLQIAALAAGIVLRIANR